MSSTFAGQSDLVDPAQQEQVGIDQHFDRMMQTQQSMTDSTQFLGKPPGGVQMTVGAPELVQPTEGGVSLRSLFMASGRDKALAEKMSPGLFDAGGQLDPSKITQNAAGEFVVQITDQKAWADASRKLVRGAAESVKTTESMTIKSLDDHMAGEDGSLTDAARVFMEHRSDKMYDGSDARAQEVRALTGMAAIKVGQVRGILGGQKIIPFQTPGGSTGQLDIGSGKLSTVDHATGEVKEFSKAQGDQILQQLFKGDQQFFRKVTHATMPKIKAEPSQVDQMMKRKTVSKVGTPEEMQNASIEGGKSKAAQEAQFNTLDSPYTTERDRQTNTSLNDSHQADLAASGGSYDTYAANNEKEYKAYKANKANYFAKSDAAGKVKSAESVARLDDLAREAQKASGSDILKYQKEFIRLYKEDRANDPTHDSDLERRMKRGKAEMNQAHEAAAKVGREGSPAYRAVVDKALKKQFERDYAELKAREASK